MMQILYHRHFFEPSAKRHIQGISQARRQPAQAYFGVGHECLDRDQSSDLDIPALAAIGYNARLLNGAFFDNGATKRKYVEDDYPLTFSDNMIYTTIYRR